MSSGVLDEVDDPLDMVLDDRTARAYQLEPPSTLGGDGFRRTPDKDILDDDDLLLTNATAIDPEDDLVEEDDDYGNDDEDEDEDLY